LKNEVIIYVLSGGGIYAGDNNSAHTDRFGHFHSRFLQRILQTLTSSYGARTVCDASSLSVGFQSPHHA
jgi:hypothetical protein